MFSTSLAVLDGYQRLSLRLIKKYSGWQSKNAEFLVVASICSLAFIVISIFSASMKAMADFATSICFIASPLFAILNHKVLFGELIKNTPPKFIKYLSYTNILFFSVLSTYFFILKLI